MDTKNARYVKDRFSTCVIVYLWYSWEETSHEHYTGCSNREEGQSRARVGRARALHARVRVSGPPAALEPCYAVRRAVRPLERTNGGLVLPVYHPGPKTRSEGLTARSRTIAPGVSTPETGSGGVVRRCVRPREPLLRACVCTRASPARHVRYPRRAVCAPRRAARRMYAGRYTGR